MLQNTRHDAVSYHPGTTVLTYEEELSPTQPTTLQALLQRPGDTEGSSNSEGSHATGDSGRYSHDETELANLSSGPSSHLPSPTESDCSSCAEESKKLSEESQTRQKIEEPLNASCCHHEAQSTVWTCVLPCEVVMAAVYRNISYIKVFTLTRSVCTQLCFLVYSHCMPVRATENDRNSSSTGHFLWKVRWEDWEALFEYLSNMNLEPAAG